MIKLDYRQHQCPYPVIETRKQMLAEPGQILEVLVADTAARDNVSRLAQKMDYQATITPQGDGFCLTLTPEGAPTNSANAAAPTTPDQPQGKTVIYCGSDRMGNGDDEFGRILLRNFLTTLLEMAPLPDIILFVNSGINLTTTGSPCLDALKSLESQGVDIASCGLCLDFYEKKNELCVGRTTNMYEMAEVQCHAARVITP